MRKPSRAVKALFQSRYRAASHFRRGTGGLHPRSRVFVSISLSSGFSFQGIRTAWQRHRALPSFNLVIERLLISGRWGGVHIRP